MNLARLVTREILHRKVNFALGLGSVAVAVVCLTGAVLFLRSFDRETESLTAAMEESTRAEMARLEDEIRKSMKGLGFNIFIFPQGQDLGEVYSRGYASQTMPETYVDTLASSDIVTVNHLLPRLTRKIEWTEQQRTVLLIGVRGEVPIRHRDPKKPLLDPVAPGEVVLGYELHRGPGLSPGDTVALLGRDFKVAKTHASRGSVDDITIWMNLAEAQELLGQPGQINSILALECNCASVDRLAEVRAEISKILPGTQIIEKGSQALARAEARNTAQAAAASQLAEVRGRRAELRAGREANAALLVPLVALLAMAWVGALTFTNVRERTVEIGTLRAIGVGSGTILAAFLGRAALTGLAGAAAGLALALAAGGALADRWLGGAGPSAFITAAEIGGTLLITPLLAAAAAWVPSLLAAQQDPAAILRVR